MISITDGVGGVERTAVHENAAIVEDEVHVPPNIPPKAGRRDITVGGRKHRRGLVLI